LFFPRGRIVLHSETASPATTPGPRAEYARRAAERQARADRLAERYHTFFRARTGAFCAIVATAWLAEKERLLPLLLSLPVVLFVSFVLEKNRAQRAWQRAFSALRFYERRLTNVEERWAGTGEPGNRFLDDAHLCARDLDLFGPGSLFERLHLAGTPLGEATLAAWLRSPAGAEEVRGRQDAVAELRDRLDLREDLALLGQQVPGRLNAAALAAWARAPSVPGIRLARPATAAFAALDALTLLGCLLGLGPVPFLATLALAGGVALALRRRVTRSLPAAAVEGADLRPLVAVLARVRREPFAAPKLCRLRATLAASRPLVHLVRLLGGLPFAPLAFPFLGATQLSLALEAWRTSHGRALPEWLAALGELEALNALAAYAFENPADPFAEMWDEGPCFEADGLGHPLLAAARCVRNDVRLSGEERLLIVSGSNMSGKSTLLRTVGANAVLALAGAPVRATHLRIAPLTPGATLRLQDSLLEGRSRFFAEVTRVRQLLDLARTHPPLLFLLDELFSGTNSDDRRQGAEAVVRRLLDSGAVGLLTTHDLALTHLAEVLAPRAANVHFADQLADGGMTFDYKMRPGVLKNGNGLALMRAVGIDV
jgi:hypothetical protein